MKSMREAITDMATHMVAKIATVMGMKRKMRKNLMAIAMEVIAEI